jgi:hypothetical protein
LPASASGLPAHAAPLLAQVHYCSVECQRKHWGVGGHKAVCKARQAVRNAAAVEDTAPVRATGIPTTSPHASSAAPKRRGHQSGTCFICLGNDPTPIQSGCGCRGDGGLAHVECRVEVAVHDQQRATPGKEMMPWERCRTCGQLFVGAMQLGLSSALWHRSRDLPEKSSVRLAAAVGFGKALINNGKSSEAEPFLRASVAAAERAWGPSSPVVMGILSILGEALLDLGQIEQDDAKLHEAALLFARTRAVFMSVFGPEHEMTAGSATNLAEVLNLLDRTDEACPLYREALSTYMRVGGAQYIQTLICALNLANALSSTGELDAATALFAEHLPTAKRVLGPEHMTTLQMARSCAMNLRRLGQLADAEAMLVETLATQKRVCGREHPDTQDTAYRLGLVRKDIAQAHRANKSV